jgi:transposase
MTCETDDTRPVAPPSAARASWGAPPSAAGSTGAGGAERSEPAVDAASGGAIERGGPDWTSAEKGRSPLGCVRSDATTERTTMFDMLHRHAVQVLAAAGVKQARIREVTGVSERTIRRIAREPAVKGPDDAAEHGRGKVGRPTKTAAFADLVKGWLTEDPKLLSVEIFRRMKLKGYEGRRTAAYELVASLRPRADRLVMRFEGLAGEFTQHDFGEVIVRFQDGRRQRIQFFATRLKYSRWVEVSIVPNQQAETLIRAMHRHLQAIGGMPLLAVFDRPTTIAKKWDKTGKVIEWNPTFRQAMFGLGLGVELCWPHRGQQKGSVENLVGWVKGSFFTQRRFVDYEDLLQQLAEWLHEVNTIRPSRATGVTPAERMEAERERLRPLPVAADDFALEFPGFVGPTAEISFEGGIYTMPPQAACMAAQIHAFPTRIMIVAGKHQAIHERKASGQRSVLPEHRAAHLAAVSGVRAKRYMKREHLLQLGNEALAYLGELVFRRPDRWYKDVDAMHAWLQQEGDEAVLSAIRRALHSRVFGSEYVRWFLKHPDSAGAELDR